MTEPFMLDLHAYLERLGYSSAPPPTLDTLRELQVRHTAEFPFETLASMLRVPVEVEPAAIQDKLLRQGRGGYCFELNRLYLLLLQALGFDARGLTGRVVMGGSEDALPARTHMLVLVTIDGVRYITDVGFGGMVPTGPLLLDSEAEQATPHEPYRLTLVDGTYPDSPFLGQMIAALTGPGLRKTLNNGSFAIHRLGQASERVQLQSVDEVLRVLREEFGIRVPEHPELRQIIERLIAGA